MNKPDEYSRDPAAARRAIPRWEAQWIWNTRNLTAIDSHVLFRRSFDLKAPATRAVLFITASTVYRVWINGTPVGQGPVASDPAWQFFDEFTFGPQLRRGVNTIAVLAYNAGLSTNDRQCAPAGLLCQLEVQTDKGALTIFSDASWKAAPAASFAPGSPRQCWTAGFAETALLDKDPDWTSPELKDAAWKNAEALGPVSTYPWLRILPRPIPRFLIGWQTVTGGLRGRADTAGIQTVGFDRVLAPGNTGIVYAAGWFKAPEAGTFEVCFECDDAAILFVNGDRVAAIDYDEEFVRTRTWLMRDEFDQVHYGATGRLGPVSRQVNLKAGWNRVTVAVDHGPGCWGFILAFLPRRAAPGEANSPSGSLDARDCFAWPIHTQPKEEAPRGWAIAGPWPSTALNDSLIGLGPEPPTTTPGASPATYNGEDHSRSTDYGMLMRLEARRDMTAIATPLLPLTLNAGEVAILNLAQPSTGFPELKIDARDKAIVDVGINFATFSDHRIRFVNDGVKFVDRLYTRNGIQTWRPLLRRSGQLLHIACRRGTVTIQSAGLHTSTCPTAKPAAFQCADDLLNGIYDASLHTARLLMQETWQTSLRREASAANIQAFAYASIGALLSLGETSITRHTIQTILRTQERNGWIDTRGLAGGTRDDVTQGLMLLIWLRDWYRETGDRDMVRQTWPQLEGSFGYFLKMINRHGLIDGRQRHASHAGERVYLADELFDLTAYRGGVFTELAGYNILFAAAARAMSDLAQALGAGERGERYSRIAGRARRSFDERFWDADRQRYAAVRDDAAPGAEYHPVIDLFALHHQVAPTFHIQQLLTNVLMQLGPDALARPGYPLRTLGVHHHLFEVLFRAKKSSQALELMRRSYGAWVKQGFRAMPESFCAADPEPGSLPGEYEIHAYGLGALPHFFRNILGVRAASPGYAQIQVAPPAADLNWARGSIHIPQGILQIAWERRDHRVNIDLTLPADIPCEVVPPAGFETGKVKINR